MFFFGKVLSGFPNITISKRQIILTMSFHHSACDIRLRSEPSCTFLSAICNNDEGSGLIDNIPLDEYLGNENGETLVLQIISYLTNRLSLGQFSWGGKNFSHDARSITLLTQGPDKRPILHSDLRDSSGNFVPSEIDLATHIANIGGQLVYLS